MKSHECWGISDLQHVSSTTCLFMFTTRRTSKARHCWPFVRGILQWYFINIISKFIFDYYSHNPIRSPSSAVMPCMNLWPDWMIIFQVREHIFYFLIGLWAHKHLWNSQANNPCSINKIKYFFLPHLVDLTLTYLGHYLKYGLHGCYWWYGCDAILKQRPRLMPNITHFKSYNHL